MQLKEIIENLKSIVSLKNQSIEALEKNKNFQNNQNYYEDTESSLYKEQIKNLIRENVRHMVQADQLIAENKSSVKQLNEKHEKETEVLEAKIKELNEQIETAGGQLKKDLAQQRQDLEKQKQDLENSYKQEKEQLEQSVESLKSQIKDLQNEKERMETSLQFAKDMQGGLASVVFSSFKKLATDHQLKDDEALAKHIMAALAAMNQKRPTDQQIKVQPASCLAFVKMLKTKDSLDKLDNGWVVQAKAFLRQVLRFLSGTVLIRFANFVINRDIGNTVWHLWQSQKELNDRTVECATAIGANIEALIAAVKEEIQISKGKPEGKDKEKQHKTVTIKSNEAKLGEENANESKTQPIGKSEAKPEEQDANEGSKLNPEVKKDEENIDAAGEIEQKKGFQDFIQKQGENGVNIAP